MNWNQFRKAHKGLSKEEMSSLWKKYKAGEYEVESEVAATNDEIRVPVGDVEVKIKPGDDGEFGTSDDQATITVTEVKPKKTRKRKPKESDNIDPNHGHDLDYIKEVENEIKREETEQKCLNRLNNKEYSVALRDFTHW